MVRKCRGVAEVTVMELTRVGVRTRAQAALDMEAKRSRSEKRTKVEEAELLISATPHVQLRRRKVNALENSTLVTSMVERNAGMSKCSSLRSDQVAASCCSSNRSNELLDERIDVGEMEDVNGEIEESTYNCGIERRETTPTGHLPAEKISNGLQSMDDQTEELSPRRFIPANMPIESEIEEFFNVAEESPRKRFAEKYNYDIVNDKPLEGRYEWVREKP